MYAESVRREAIADAIAGLVTEEAPETMIMSEMEALRENLAGDLSGGDSSSSTTWRASGSPKRSSRLVFGSAPTAVSNWISHCEQWLRRRD